MTERKGVPALLALLLLAGCPQDKAQTSTSTASAENQSTNYLGAHVRAFNLLGEAGQTIRQALEQPTPASLRAELSPRLKLAEEALGQARKHTPAAKADLVEQAESLLRETRALSSAYERQLEAAPQTPEARRQALARELKAQQEAIRRLGQDLEKLEDEQMAAEVQKRADKKDYGYWFRFFNVEAKRMTKAAQQGRHESLPDLEQARQQLSRFAQSLGANIDPHFAAYVEQAERLSAAGRAWHAKPEAAERKALDEAFNKLIDLGNDLYTREARGRLK